MMLANRMNRVFAIAMLAASSVLVLAPVAEAGRGHESRRYKNTRHARHDHRSHRVIIRDSGAGPVLAGLVGGFLLGTAVSRSAPVVVHEREVVHHAPRYRYWDPYCDSWFVSLSDCREHGFHRGHPRVVKVFDGYDGPCVRTLRWSDGAWYDIDDDDWRD